MSIDLPGLAAPVEPAQAAAAATLRAQAIDCGGFAVAVPYAWARNVVEQFDLSLVPNAPAWLAGAVNVDGRILPVLDLAAWLDARQPQAVSRGSRLLVGGEGDEAYALLFQGLPRLARYEPGAPPSEIPAALRAHAVATAQVGGTVQAPGLPVIDMHGMGAEWRSELAA